MVRKSILTIVSGLLVFMALGGGVAFGAHDSVTLIGYDGKELTVKSQQPYSPKLTCGECHDYAAITNGYHFQQGRTNASGEIVMSDRFDPKRLWIKSDGMFGKW